MAIVMSRKAFLAHVRRIRGWQLCPSGEIRHGEHCPMTKVCEVVKAVVFDYQAWGLASDVLRLTDITAELTLECADSSEEELRLNSLIAGKPGPEFRRQAKYRRQLLHAARLKELSVED